MSLSEFVAVEVCRGTPWITGSMALRAEGFDGSAKSPELSGWTPIAGCRS